LERSPPHGRGLPAAFLFKRSAAFSRKALLQPLEIVD
jgi:hypothetical protein